MSRQLQASPQMTNVIRSLELLDDLLHIGIAVNDYGNYAANVVNTSGDKRVTSWKSYYMECTRSFCKVRQTINHPSELPQEFDKLRHPQNFEDFKCANSNCENHANIGGHVYVKGCGAELNCIVPLCYSCNNNRALDWSTAKKYTFPLRPGTFVVYIDAADLTYSEFTNRIWTRKGRRAVTSKARAMRDEKSDQDYEG